MGNLEPEILHQSKRVTSVSKDVEPEARTRGNLSLLKGKSKTETVQRREYPILDSNKNVAKGNGSNDNVVAPTVNQLKNMAYCPYNNNINPINHKHHHFSSILFIYLFNRKPTKKITQFIKDMKETLQSLSTNYIIP